MSKPFEALGERLLREGVAPRHVRAYLTELREHLADIIEQECAAGGDAGEALARAHARLGDEDMLAAAMLSRRRVRSLTARAPWLVLGLLQPFTLIIAMFVTMLLALMSLFLLRKFLGEAATLQLGPVIVSMGNLLAAPMVMGLFAVIVWRQRLALAWALLGCAIILLLFPYMNFWLAPQDPASFPPGARLQYNAGHFILGMGLAPIFHPRTWAIVAMQWPVAVAQCVLTLLPAAWLWFARRRRAA